jgi:hypothetical protein
MRAVLSINYYSEMHLTSRAKYALVVYFLVTLWLTAIAPGFCFKGDGSPKGFGLGYEQTLCPFYAISTAIALATYIILAVVLPDD